LNRQQGVKYQIDKVLLRTSPQIKGQVIALKVNWNQASKVLKAI
jgi:hypothetical protein